jgi:DNA-binding transcriptional regulator YhcF (GntR family)
MLVTLDSSLRKPLYVQIRDQLRGRILDGGLKPGDRLEPSRELAHQLGVHRTTVGNAYADLESEGLIQGTVGRGTFVTPLGETLRSPRSRPRRSSHDLFWEGFFPEEPHDDSLGRLMASSVEEGVISFAAAHGAEELTSPELVPASQGLSANALAARRHSRGTRRDPGDPRLPTVARSAAPRAGIPGRNGGV